MNRINILSYLEESAVKYKDKIAFSDEVSELSFGKMLSAARSAGSFLLEKGFYKKPVVVFMKKSPDMINAFLGAVYAGCYYVPIDEEMPEHRIKLIFETLKPEIVIYDDTTEESVRELLGAAKGEAAEGKAAEGAATIAEGDATIAAYKYKDAAAAQENAEALRRVREKAIDTDPVYIVFTSGSTGIPKGVAACHRSVIDYIENLSEILHASEDTVFGNQAPLYVDACLKEIYTTLKCGASTYIIPKQLFMFPVKLVQYLNEHKINTVCWVVPALTMISGFGTFRTVVPETLKTIAFGSEVFPVKQFNIWKKQLPGARFINLYGPTEATGMSCYYEADREFAEDEVIPIGKPFRNTDIMLLTDKGEPALPGEPGEICIRGTSLTLGYYGDFTRTDEAFVQNPLSRAYRELIYKTGDIGRYNERGELMFISRRDYQIKHMGHRIELGEIEMTADRAEGVANSCCIYKKSGKDARGKIILFYEGSASEEALLKELKERLPRYMVPSVIKRTDRLPLTANGKIDRKALTSSEDS